MLVVKITKKINSDDNEFEKFKSKIKKIYKKYKKHNKKLRIKLVIEEGIEEICPQIINLQELKDCVEEIEYPSSILKLSKIFNSKICYDKTSLNSYSSLKGLEIIGEEVFYNKKIVNPIWISPFIKKFLSGAFEKSEIDKMIFLSQDIEIASNAFSESKINKLYCGSIKLLEFFNDYLLNWTKWIINRGDAKLLSEVNLPINELIIPESMIFDFIESFCLKGTIRDTISIKIIIDCPNDFYHHYVYRDCIEKIKKSLKNCEIIMDHDYVANNFKEVKDFYKPPLLDVYTNFTNEKCTKILNNCYNEDMRNTVLKMLLEMVDENNSRLLQQKEESYEMFSNQTLILSNDYSNKFNENILELEKKVDLTKAKLKYYDEILAFIEETINMINIHKVGDIDIDYLDESLYSDIWRYLYILDFANLEVKDEYTKNLINILKILKEKIICKKEEVLNLFPNIDTILDDSFNFEIEFRKKLFLQILSFYKKNLSIDKNSYMIGVRENQNIDIENYEKNTKCEVIKSFIEDIMELKYLLSMKQIERINEILNTNLMFLKDDELKNIVEELANINLYLIIKEKNVKKQGLLR